MSAQWSDDVFEDARIAFGELDVRERVAQALLDENGLAPTNGALDVILVAYQATQRADYNHNRHAGTPTVTDYAKRARRTLRELIAVHA